MVLPIILSIGATVLALTGKATISAYRKFQFLTPTMIASLNGITLTDVTSDTSLNKTDPRYNDYIRIRSQFANSGFSNPMTEQEALLILGIQGDDILILDDKMVRDRYRRLMMLNHPDKNGSQYLSQKLNNAKDILEKSYMVKRTKR
jgi:hypothetical protein